MENNRFRSKNSSYIDKNNTKRIILLFRTDDGDATHGSPMQ